MLLDDVAQPAALVSPVSRDRTLEDEFGERVADSSTLAFRVALGVLRHREDAEDVAQEAFLRAHRAFASLRDRDRFRAWLVRTAFRLALDRQRSDRRRRRREDRAAGKSAGATESLQVGMEREETRRRVGKAVDALPEKLRIVTVLAAIEGHGLAEVARLLEIPEGTVKSRPSFQYRNVGINLQCQAREIGGEVFEIVLWLETSTVYAGAEELDAAYEAQAPGGRTMFRTFNVALSPLLRDGESVETVASADPVTGEVVKVGVSMEVVK